MKKFLPAIIIFSLFLIAGSTSAYMMSSPNYRIQSDSINVGGLYQTSASYRMKETIGEIATGISTSPSYKLKAGYQQMQEIYLAISVDPLSVSMSPDIPGLSGGTSNGSTTATVTTDNPAGYTLAIKASTSPALQSGANSFADYTPATPGLPDFNWSVPATTSEFGFNPYNSSDQVQKFRHDIGNNCNTGTSVTDLRCWYFLSTSDETIARSFSANHPTGSETKVNLRAESGNQNIQPSGIYQATITVTAFAN